MRMGMKLEIRKDLEIIDIVEHYRNEGWNDKYIAERCGTDKDTLFHAYRIATIRRKLLKGDYGSEYVEMVCGNGSGTRYAEIWSSLPGNHIQWDRTPRGAAS